MSQGDDRNWVAFRFANLILIGIIVALNLGVSISGEIFGLGKVYSNVLFFTVIFSGLFCSVISIYFRKSIIFGVVLLALSILMLLTFFL